MIPTALHLSEKVVESRRVAARAREWLLRFSLTERMMRKVIGAFSRVRHAHGLRGVRGHSAAPSMRERQMTPPTVSIICE